MERKYPVIKSLFSFSLLIICLFFINNGLIAQNTAIPNKVVKGIVTDSKGDPLQGVSVIVKGSSVGVATDQSGNYSINISDTTSVLVFSYVGTTPQEIPVGG